MSSPYAWPFAKKRTSWINQADTFLSVAQSSLSQCENSVPETPLEFRHWRRAARYMARAAELYRKAGLGKAARDAFLGACDCWQAVNQADERSQCLASAESIDVYWEGEVDA